jgi:5'(3')-deoxyribonucleotidase
MAIIAVDMDEVIADALGKHLEQYNNHFGKSVTREDTLGTHLRHIVPVDHQDIVEQFIFSEEFFADLPVMEDAQRVLLSLSKTHEIFIASAAMEVPSSFTAKYEWMKEHFPFVSPMNIVFCGDKSILNADYLIDDNARHFKRFRGQGILFDAPHNNKVTGYPRVKNWKEVEQYFAKVGKEAATSAR